ncbi:response regulator [Acidovorax sp. LjRoot66]
MTPTGPETVLVVDDDPEIRQLLGQFLGAAGVRTLVAAHGSEMRAHLQQHPVDLVVLDVMLPQEGGLDLLRWLREHTRVPVIMVTALGSPIDRVVGLEIGADDYLAKPFEPRELLARIRAVMRRAPARVGSAPSNTLPGRLRFGAWRLDTALRELRHEDGVVVPLPTSEYQLLCVFLLHPRSVLSREQLAELAQGRELAPAGRALDLQVYRLRQRLRDAGDAQLIKTVRNTGYVLDTSVHALPPDA